MSSNNMMPVERQVQIQIQDGKMGMGLGMDSSTMSGPLVAHSGILDGDYERTPTVGKMQMRFDLANVALRLLSLACSVVALVSMASNQESGVVTVFGFKLVVYSKWSYSDSFERSVPEAGARPETDHQMFNCMHYTCMHYTCRLKHDDPRHFPCTRHYLLPPRFHLHLHAQFWKHSQGFRWDRMTSSI